MEFYVSIILNTKSLISGFNSQRDGILRVVLAFLFFYNLVSIPNGMEFYSIPKLKQIHAKKRFNSQRDGILLREKEFRSSVSGRFQFPTGWNSTDIDIELTAA